MRFGILGDLEIADGQRPIVIRANKQRVLLAVLLIRPNATVQPNELIEALWPDGSPDSAADNLRLYVHRLRRALGDSDRIVRSPSGYHLDVGSGELDADEFVGLTKRAQRLLADGELGLGADSYQAALSLWRGQALADVRDCPVLQAESHRLEELRITALGARIDIDLALGRHAEVIPELQQLIARHPLRERLRAQLMTALYRSGRQAEALCAYRGARQVLIDELGLEPGTELRELERAILSGQSTPPYPAAGGSGPELSTQDRCVTACLLPTDLADFAGRQDELEFLIRALTTGDGTAVPVAVVAGRGGIGKTSLAVRAAHRLKELFPDGQLYVNLHGVETHPADPAAVLTRFLRVLGVDSAAIPTSTDERAEIYRARLHGRRVLVVLDNAADAAQVQPLLPGSPTCGVLVTSRARLTGLPGGQLLDLGELTADQAMDLLRRTVGPGRIVAEPAAAVELVRLCGRLPLALRIIGARLADRPHWSLPRMVARLADQQHRLDELAHGHLDVRASLALSHRVLDGNSKLLFALLGLLDAPDFASWVAAALLDSTLPQAEELLDRLVDVQLLDLVDTNPRTGVPRYRFHDLVRFYARECAQADVPVPARRAALERAFAALLSLAEVAHTKLAGQHHLVVHGDAPRWLLPPTAVSAIVSDPVLWCEAERLTIIAAVRQVADEGLAELCWDLAVTTAPLFEVRRHYDDWEETHRFALAAVRTAGNIRGQAAVLAERAELLIEKHEYKEASRLLNTAVEQFGQLGDERGRALALHKVSVIERIRGSYKSALARSASVVRILDAAGDLGNKALVLRCMGQIHLDRGDRDNALRCLEEALGVAQRAGAHRLHAQVLYRLGEVYLDLTWLDLAEAAFKEVLDLVRELGDPPGQIYALYGLGCTRLGQGDYQRASALLTEALALSRDISESLCEAMVLLALGKLHSALRQGTAAITCFAEAVRISRGLGATLLTAKAQYSLGEAYHVAGNDAAAAEAWTEALTLFDQIGAAEAKLTADRLNDLTSTRV